MKQEPIKVISYVDSSLAYLLDFLQMIFKAFPVPERIYQTKYNYILG
jgi:hypothetical protein